MGCRSVATRAAPQQGASGSAGGHRFTRARRTTNTLRPRTREQEKPCGEEEGGLRLCSCNLATSRPNGLRVKTQRRRCLAEDAGCPSPSPSGSPLTVMTDLFPLWVVLACSVALWKPLLFSWFKGTPFVFGLSTTMLGMGLTLTLDDVRQALYRYKDVSRGCLLQYTVMPLLGFLASRAFNLPSSFAVGVVLVACCPGGTASNIVSYLARADVPLSVMMTTLSTAGAVFMTPLLTKIFAGTLVPVDASAMLWSTAQIVLLPVVLGAFANTNFPKTTAKVARVTPVYAVLMVAFVCASVVSRNVETILSSGANLLLPLLVLHAGGFGIGYFITKFTGGSERVSRTTSIEVGMQNSTLGCVLATLHFADAMTAAPAAISACVHSVMGSVIAGLWRFRDAKQSSMNGKGM